MTHRSGNLSKVFAKSGTDREEPLPPSTTTPPKPPASLGAVWGYGHRPIINHLTHTLWIRMMTICWVTINHLNTHRMMIIWHAEVFGILRKLSIFNAQKSQIWMKMTFTIIYRVNVKLWESHSFTLSLNPICRLAKYLQISMEIRVRTYEIFPHMSLE